jgi:hypothetical protein
MMKVNSNWLCLPRLVKTAGQLLPTSPHGDEVFFRLQDGERIPEEDLHLSDPSRFQAHMPSLQGLVLSNTPRA